VARKVAVISFCGTRCLLASLQLVPPRLPASFPCRFVIHTAGVVSLNAPKRVAYSRVIEPTVKGIENVLSAVNKAPGVEKGRSRPGLPSSNAASLHATVTVPALNRIHPSAPSLAVVLTSSLVAVSGDLHDRGPGHVYCEGDWNLGFCELEEPYVTCAVQSPCTCSVATMPSCSKCSAVRLCMDGKTVPCCAVNFCWAGSSGFDVRVLKSPIVHPPAHPDSLQGQGAGRVAGLGHRWAAAALAPGGSVPWECVRPSNGNQSQQRYGMLSSCACALPGRSSGGTAAVQDNPLSIDPPLTQGGAGRCARRLHVGTSMKVAGLRRLHSSSCCLLPRMQVRSHQWSSKWMVPFTHSWPLLVRCSACDVVQSCRPHPPATA
jgi:hypothetical protein